MITLIIGGSKMKHRFLKPVILLQLVLLILLPSCANNSVRVASFSTGAVAYVPAADNKEIRITDPSRLQNVCENEHLRLLFDRTIGAVSVYDTEKHVYWNALPAFGNTASSVLSASILSEQGSYVLNSQDNSVAFGTFSVQESEDGLTITYVLSDTRETAEKEYNALDAGDLYLSVPIRFSLKNGALYVSVNCADILQSEGYYLKDLSVLPYFGALLQIANEDTPPQKMAAESPEDGEEPQDETKQEAAAAAVPAYRPFMLVPDGCGAVMYIDTPEAATQDIAFSVGTAGEHPAAAGCFGIAGIEGALAGTVTDGSSIASVRAVRNIANTDGVNTVFPEFSVTPVRLKGNRYICGRAYTGQIGIVYQFLGGRGINAMEIAGACRESMIRSGIISGELLPENTYPMHVSMAMSVTGEHSSRVTELAQVEELAGVLKAKGIDRLNLILNGLFEGGFYQNSGCSYKVSGTLGGSRALMQLCDYASSQNIGVFAGANLLFAGKASRSATDLDGKKQQVFAENPLYPSVGDFGQLCYLADAPEIDRNSIRLLNKTKKYALAGYAVSDISFGNYNDYAAKAEQETVTDTIRRNLAAAAAQKQLILPAADFRYLRYADSVLNVPLTASYDESDGYLPTPLIPAVLHGTLVYSGQIANHGEAYLTNILKSVEYGAAFYLGWNFLPGNEQFYELTYSDIAELYSRTLRELGELTSRRITDHVKISEGVFATSYEGGSTVYVNYNNYSVSIGTISVPPYDYLRLG